MAYSLTGTRIRELRRRAGQSQTALAAAAGISTSYLNLIEHNKRGIAGRVLQAIARELGVTPAELSEEADSALMESLEQAATAAPDLHAERAALPELMGRFPGWSAMIADLYRRTQNQATEIEVLSDRLSHDPFLADSLHQMLSNITAIRSTASILTSVGDVPMDQQARFQTAIHQESRRLSDAAEALVEYFDRSALEGIQAATPEEELENFLSANDHHFPSLDDGTGRVKQLLQAPELQTSAAKRLAEGALETYRDDAKAMPLVAFAKSAEAAQWDPAALAAEFNISLHAVFRRLSTLRRDGLDAPKMGLLMVNAAGQPLLRRPIEGFPMPRHNTTCPLWPVYQCLSMPGRPMQDSIALPDGTQFASFAIALPTGPARFDRPTPHIGAMLLVTSEDAAAHMPWLSASEPRDVGTNCRISPCAGCIGSRIE